MKVFGVRHASPEAGALTLFGLLPEPEMTESEPEAVAAWFTALARKAGPAAAAKARKLRAAKLAVAA